MKFYSLLASILLVTLLFGCEKNEQDFGLTELNNKQFSSVGIYYGKISSIDESKLSPNYTKVNSFKIEITKTLAKSNNQQLESNKTQIMVLTDKEMIAPFETTTLDQRENLNIGESLVVYVIKQNESFQAVHISKVINEKVIFPAYKGNPSVSIEIGDYESKIKKQFSKLFRLSSHLESVKSILPESQ